MPQLEEIKKKILCGSEIDSVLELYRKAAQRIVFTNGCFDLLHLGHVDYLSKASDLGDVLIVGVNSDASIRKIKGNNRPITDETSRAMIIASLMFVDAVILFEEETPYNLIKNIQPDILVKGDDYQIDNIVGADIVIAKRGQIHTIPLVKGYSTSLIESKILSMK
jgi:D-glycero-beta-D-manno-heptose 1-phosphate adenylyltransferase